MYKQVSRHKPLFLLMQGFLAIPKSKYFPTYNEEYLRIRLSGYFKAFHEYHVFKLTQIIYSMRKNLEETKANERQMVSGLEN